MAQDPYCGSDVTIIAAEQIIAHKQNAGTLGTSTKVVVEHRERYMSVLYRSFVEQTRAELERLGKTQAFNRICGGRGREEVAATMIPDFVTFKRRAVTRAAKEFWGIDVTLPR